MCQPNIIFMVLFNLVLLVQTDANPLTTSTKFNVILEKNNNNAKENAIKNTRYSPPGNLPEENIELTQKIYPQFPTKLIDSLAFSQGLKAYQGPVNKPANLLKQPRMIVKSQPTNMLLDKDNNRGNLRTGINFIEPRIYKPNPIHEKICLGRSTGYNYPRVHSYLLHRMYHPMVNYPRQLWLDLRFELFVNGRSEECHVEELNTWRSFLECSLLRNQRMEYMVPMYPLTQFGRVNQYGEFVHSYNLL